MFRDKTNHNNHANNNSMTGDSPADIAKTLRDSSDFEMMELPQSDLLIDKNFLPGDIFPNSIDEFFNLLREDENELTRLIDTRHADLMKLFKKGQDIIRFVDTNMMLALRMFQHYQGYLNELLTPAEQIELSEVGDKRIAEIKEANKKEYDSIADEEGYDEDTALRRAIAMSMGKEDDGYSNQITDKYDRNNNNNNTNFHQTMWDELGISRDEYFASLYVEQQYQISESQSMEVETTVKQFSDRAIILDDMVKQLTVYTSKDMIDRRKIENLLIPYNLSEIEVIFNAWNELCMRYHEFVQPADLELLAQCSFEHIGSILAGLLSLYSADPVLVNQRTRLLLDACPKYANRIGHGIEILNQAHPILVSPLNMTLLRTHAKDAVLLAMGIRTLFSLGLASETNNCFLANNSSHAAVIADILAILYRANPTFALEAIEIFDAIPFTVEQQLSGYVANYYSNIYNCLDNLIEDRALIDEDSFHSIIHFSEQFCKNRKPKKYSDSTQQITSDLMRASLNTLSLQSSQECCSESNDANSPISETQPRGHLEHGKDEMLEDEPQHNSYRFSNR